MVTDTIAVTAAPAVTERRGYLGGTDIAAIIGASPWKTAFQVWLEKTGQAPAFEGNEATRWGSILERPVAEEFARQHGDARLIPGEFIWLPEAPHLGGHPDFLVDLLTDTRTDALEHAGLEIKTAGLRSAHRWSDPAAGEPTRVPDEYLCQCAWYQALTQRPVWWIAVLIGGQDYREYRIERDTDLEGRLVEAGQKFWRDHVVGGRPPPIDASEAAGDFLHRRFPREQSKDIRVATPDEAGVLGQYREVLRQIGELESVKGLCENRIKELIGTSGGIVAAELGKVTWTANKDSRRTDWQAVAQAVGVPEALIEAHTKTVPGARVLRKHWSE